MMGELVSSGVLGAGVGYIGAAITGLFKMWQENQRLLAGLKIDELVTRYGGDDKIGERPSVQWVRRFLVIIIFGTLSTAIVYALFHPEIVGTEVVDRTGGFFNMIVGGTNKGTIQREVVSLLFDYKNFAAFVCGFYLTRIKV